MNRSQNSLIGLLLIACILSSTAAAQSRPNLVLIVADDLGPDLGCYGNDVIQTPNIDALAAEGALFRNAFCTTASCSASRSVILTGLHNHRNGHYGHEHSYHHFSSFDAVRSLPVRLTEAGYETARVGKYHVAPQSVYKFDTALKGNGRNGVEMAEYVSQWLNQRRSEQPFFLYYCTSDPHRGGGFRQDKPLGPDAFGNRPDGYPGVEQKVYDPADVVVPPFLPDTPTCRAELAEYYESVSRFDSGVGAVVAALKKAGEYDDSVIIVTSDHGIAFPGGKTNQYEPGLKIPFVVRAPDMKNAGGENNAMISLVDLTPTLLEWAGAEVEEGAFHGRSWAGAVDQQDPQGWNRIYGSHTFHEITMYYPMRTVRDRQYKLIWNIAHPLPYPFASDLWRAPTFQERLRQGPETLYGQRSVADYMQRPQFELFDLQADPNESHNLADDPAHAEKLAELQGEIRRFQKETKDPWILKWDYE